MLCTILKSRLSMDQKQKHCKDAAVYESNTTRGEVRFLPDEYQNELLETEHKRFQLFPVGRILEFPRHIPYSSAKKDFYEKTGREHLNVFQYEFRMPGQDGKYYILWDYNMGFVKLTPLFKCTGHSKTVPSRALGRNPGLKSISYSITGGALVAQGYWVPYQAARMLASTFCYEIRYALTPVFGRDFPHLCVRPGEPAWGSMLVDASVISRCADMARRFCQLEKRTMSHLRSPLSSAIKPSGPRRSRTSIKEHSRHASIGVSPSDSTSSSISINDGGSSFASLPPSPVARNVFTTVNKSGNTPKSISHPVRRPKRSLLLLRSAPDGVVMQTSDSCSIPPHSTPIQKLQPIAVSSERIPVVLCNKRNQSSKELSNLPPAEFLPDGIRKMLNHEVTEREEEAARSLMCLRHGKRSHVQESVDSALSSRA